MPHEVNARLESRLRRAAAKHDLRIYKSRCRTPDRLDFGGYMLTTRSESFVLAGADPFPFSLSLDELADEMRSRGAVS